MGALDRSHANGAGPWTDAMPMTHARAAPCAVCACARCASYICVPHVPLVHRAPCVPHVPCVLRVSHVCMAWVQSEIKRRHIVDWDLFRMMDEDLNGKVPDGMYDGICWYVAWT